MAKNRNAVRAGIFMIVAVILIVGGVLMIAGADTLFAPKQPLVVEFKLTDNLGGLRAGDAVRIGGVKVGSVNSIDIVTEPAGQERVINFSIPDKYVLRDGAAIGIETSVTGGSMLNIESFGSGEVVTVNNPLTGQPSGLAALFSAMRAVAPQLSDTVADTRGAINDVRTSTLPRVNDTIDTYRTTAVEATALVKDVRGRIDPVTERYFAVADSARRAMTNVGDLVGEGNGDFRASLANTRDATAAVREKLPGILDRVDGTLGKIGDTLDTTQVALRDVQATVSNARDISSSTRSIIMNNRGRIDGMIASLKATSDNLKFASSEIRRSPWRLLYKPRPGEMANLNLFDSARQFAEGANDLNDAALALRDAASDDQVSDERLTTLLQSLEETFKKFQEIEAELWEQVK